MGEIENFGIVFDNPHITYSPGEVVSGRVILTLNDTKRVRGLKMKLEGEAHTSWSKRISRIGDNGIAHYSTETLTGNEVYIDIQFYLIGGSSDEIEIPAGQHQYPFDFQLPLGLPSSFAHKCGSVRYMAKAIVDKAWNFDDKTKVEFFVVAPYDLNHHPTATMPINEEDYETFCSICCIPTGNIMYDISAPVSGYVPGQIIPMTVALRNDANVTVTSISLKLKKNLIFRVNSPQFDEKEDSITVKEETATGPFGPEVNILLQLQVPPLPPSDYEFCKIINLRYELALEIHVSGLHCCMKRSYPIEIGTVPFNNFSPSTAPTDKCEFDKPAVVMQPISSRDAHLPISSVIPGPNPKPSAPIGFDSVILNPSAPIGFVDDPPPAYSSTDQPHEKTES